MTLYNLKTSGDQYRITKFTNDLDVESSYLCSAVECEGRAAPGPGKARRAAANAGRNNLALDAAGRDTAIREPVLRIGQASHPRVTRDLDRAGDT